MGHGVVSNAGTDRLGLQAVNKIGCRDEHLPEFAVHLCTERPADAAVVDLRPEQPFTDVEELGALGEVFEQDMRNLPYVQKDVRLESVALVWSPPGLRLPPPDAPSHVTCIEESRPAVGLMDEAPLVGFSSRTGEGFDEVWTHIERAARKG